MKMAKVYYEKDVTVNVLKEKKSSNHWIWLARSCACAKLT